jgi:hypothetical protein
MKRLLLIISLFIVLPTLLVSQNVTEARPYGDAKLVHDFICSEVIYPERVLESRTEGTVVLGFTVEKDVTLGAGHKARLPRSFRATIFIAFQY